MKKLFAVLVFLFQFSLILTFTSCVSKPLPIPGDTKAQINNLYVEYLNIADTFYSQENYDKAIEYYKKSISYKKVYWDCYYKLAKCYVFKSDWNTALDMFLEIQKRDPENNSIKESLAYIYAKKGDIENAVELYNQLIQSQPNNVEYLENLIAVLLLNEDISDIEILFTVLVTNFPDSKNIEKFQKQIDLILEKQAKENPEDSKHKSKKIVVEDDELPEEAEEEEEQPPVEEEVILNQKTLSDPSDEKEGKSVSASSLFGF